jgi:hypothetical protein
MRTPRCSFLAICLLGFVGCGSSKGATQGAEGTDCYPNGSCNQGLSCFSNKCVRYDAGGSGAGGGAIAGASGTGVGGATGAAGTKGAAGTTEPAGATGAAGVAGPTGAAGATGAAGIAGAAGAAGTNADASPPDAAGEMGAADTTGAAGSQACGGSDGGAGPTPEELTVAACGETPATTARAYGGRVTMTVSGIYINTPGQPLEDAFYHVDLADNSRSTDGACPECFRYNRLSEGANVCYLLSTNYRVSDLVVGGYPAFQPSHEYTVTLDLGSSPAERLDFGMADCGCSDNSGTHTVTLTPLADTACGH